VLDTTHSSAPAPWRFSSKAQLTRSKNAAY
jgi:hypothetical protein